MASTSVTDPLNLGLSGLASGIDTSAVVDALMNVAKQPQLALTHKKAQASARSTALGAIKAELNGVKGLADALRSPGLFANTQTVDSSDPTKITATRISGAGTGGSQIVVSRLASSQQRTYNFTQDTGSDTTIDFGGGKTLTIASGSTIDNVVDLINSSSASPVYAAKVTDPNDPTGTNKLLVLSSKVPGSGGDFSLASGTTTSLSEITADAKAHAATSWQQTFDYTSDPVNPTTITINGNDVTINPGSTVDDVVTAINGASTGVTASKDSNGRLLMTSNTSGSGGNFTVSSTQLASYSSTAGLDSTLTNLNAAYTVDGGPTRYATSNIVTDAVPGLQLTLKAVSADPVTITVGSPAPDIDTIKQSVHDFVDSYNALMSDLSSRISEKPVIPKSTDSDYLKGLFFGDSLLQNIQDRLRNVVMSPIGSDPSLNLLSQIGISTGATTGSGAVNQDSIAGKLVVDDDKLTQMLTDNPDGVKTLLGATVGTDGFAQALDNALNPEVQAGGDFDTLISQANSQVSDYADQIADWDQRLSDQQDRLKAQFAAMESALAKSQSTQSWLTSQIAGLQATAKQPPAFGRLPGRSFPLEWRPLDEPDPRAPGLQGERRAHGPAGAPRGDALRRHPPLPVPGRFRDARGQPRAEQQPHEARRGDHRRAEHHARHVRRRGGRAPARALQLQQASPHAGAPPAQRRHDRRGGEAARHGWRRMASDSRRLSDPYERIVALGELELELIQGGRWEELAELGAEREQLITNLPPLPPETARGPLERAAELQQRVSAELARSIALAREGLGRVDRSRRAAAGYAPPIERRKLVDSAG